MSIDWRGLFSSQGIAWRDRGSNHTRGNINIKCPWCGPLDPSAHLSISEDKPAYYCYRDSRHQGGNLLALLIKLGIGRYDAARLLNRYVIESGKPEVKKFDEPKRAESLTNQAWDRFYPIAESAAHCEYLQIRGFDNPKLVAAQYDLRYAKAGAWAQRILFPFREADGELFSWAGRAINDALTPRYKMEGEHIPGAIYQPRSARSIVILVEGPIDALKIAAATEPHDISTIALAGKAINASKLLRLRSLTKDCAQLILALDADVGIGEVSAIMRNLETALRGKQVQRLALPIGYSDPGAMPSTIIQNWLSNLLK